MTRSAPRRWKSAEILERLHRHYLGTEMFAGGEFAAEVGINGGYSSTSRCDALFAGFASRWGRVFIGHEVKVARSDWLRELDNVFKASKWADACHAWFIVAPDATIVRPEEVPPGWGLMVPDPKRPTKMKILVKPDVKPETWDPPWWAVRSFMARLNTLRGGELHRLVALEAARQVKREVEDMERRQQLLAKRGMTEADQLAISTMETFRERGVNLVRWRDRDDMDALTAHELRDPEVRRILRDSTDAEQAMVALRHRYSGATAVLKAAQDLVDAVAKLGAPGAQE